MHGSEKHRPTCSAKVFKKGILWQTSKLVPELSEMLPPKSHQSKLSKQGGSKVPSGGRVKVCHSDERAKSKLCG